MMLRQLLLSPFAFLFGLGTGIRNFLFDKGWRKIKKARVPVISIGNLTAGGTGKTPLSLYLMEMLKAGGEKPAYLSRGYGRKSAGFFWVDENANSLLLGDEACMVAAHFPDCPVAVGENRGDAAERMLKEREISVLLLDDAFQHRSIFRNWDIVLIDGTRPPQKDMLLPVGMLREPLSALNRANRVVITRLREKQEAEILANELQLKKWSAFYLEIHSFILFEGGSGIPAQEVNFQDVILFSGIGNPDGFENEIRRLGLHVRSHFAFPDHHEYRPADIEEILNKFEAEGNGRKVVLITTEKDFFRLRGRAVAKKFEGLPVYHTQTAITWLREEKELRDEVLQQIEKYGSKIR